MGYPDVETMSPSMRHIFKTIQLGRRGDATSPLPKIHLITGFENSVFFTGVYICIWLKPDISRKCSAWKDFLL